MSKASSPGSAWDAKRAEGAEAAASRRAEEQAALYQFTDRLFRAASPEEAYDAALGAILTALRCDRASILMFDGDGVMQFVASRGLSEAYRAAVAGHTPWRLGEVRPDPIAIADIMHADLASEARTAIVEEGIRALAFVPLMAGGGVVGKFMAYFDRPHAFTRDEVNLALTIARQMGFFIERDRAATALKDIEARQRRADSEFRALADNIHQLAWMTDASGWIYWYNQRWFDYTGTTLEEMQGWGWQMVHHPEHVQRVTDKFRLHIASGAPWEDTFPLRGKDGDYRWFLSRAMPIRDAQGAIARWVGTNTDITERLHAEEVRERLTAIVENSDDAIISKDLNGVIVSWNKGAERLFGYAPDEIIGKSILTLIPPELQDEEPGIIGRIRRGERIEHYETERVRKDGSRVSISLTVSPVKDGQGVIVGASKIARNITERKRAEAQRMLLLNELNHRVKNTLATVQSLALQTLRNTERSADARDLFEARLAALSRAHNLLTQESWEGADLREAMQRALEPFDVGRRFALDGASVRLSPRQALSLSIAVHELATNAAKYGALSVEGGRISLSWRIAEGHLRVAWVESGGPSVKPPTRAGFGSRLVERALAVELGGEAHIAYDPAGVRAMIVCPLANG